MVPYINGESALKSVTYISIDADLFPDLGDSALYASVGHLIEHSKKKLTPYLYL